MSEQEILTLPLVAMRDVVVYPQMNVNFEIGRAESVAAVRRASEGDGLFVTVLQKDPETEHPEAEELYTVATVLKLSKMSPLPGGHIRVLAEGVSRVELKNVEKRDGMLWASVSKVAETCADDVKAEAYRRAILDGYFKWMEAAKKMIPEEAASQLRAIQNPGQVADFIIAQLPFSPTERQRILETIDVEARLDRVKTMTDMALEITEIETKLDGEARKHMSEDQRKYFLRSKMHSIREELGEEDADEEIDEYREKLEKAGLPQEIFEKAAKEVSRLDAMGPGIAEANVIRTYLDWILDLPWSEETEDNLDLHRAKKMLDEDHFGLEKVKDRILEYLAVKILAPNAKGNILCFVGPPGVGKTSLAKSIARAMGRKFARISLGGITDEAEIRGHRRTYVGAMPGRFISAMAQAKSMNPVILLDEIDKVGADFRGDPASALLEALDPEQNKTFTDNYMDMPFDLSQVFFICTANTTQSIPDPLMDRMEIISLPGYTEEEKLEIARQYLVPREREKNGLSGDVLRFPKGLLQILIRNYTREAGVRELERTIGTLCRKTAKQVVMREEGVPALSTKTVEAYLGPYKFIRSADLHESAVGRVNGLAWTAVGGEVLDVEAVALKGSGKLELTGQLGDVMKESAQAAYTYIRSRAETLGLSDHFYEKEDIHIHLPEGAIPKDGPSAGITMATAMASAFTGRKVRSDYAMTGEINLSGEVLPIGGLKEKSLAAAQLGIENILIPEKNVRDLEEIPKSVRDTVHFIPVKHMDDVLSRVLEDGNGRN